LLLELVWSVLPEGKWESTQTLSDACGLNEDTIKRVVNFLLHWNFAEARIFPDLRVRRRTGAMDPVATVKILHSLALIENEPTPTQAIHVLAERMTCRVCASRSFRQVGDNEVECTTCRERQWLTLNKASLKQDETPPLSRIRSHF
jgi:hypothetical protein